MHYVFTVRTLTPLTCYPEAELINLERKNEEIVRSEIHQNMKNGYGLSSSIKMSY